MASDTKDYDERSFSPSFFISLSSAFPIIIILSTFGACFLSSWPWFIPNWSTSSFRVCLLFSFSFFLVLLSCPDSHCCCLSTKRWALYIITDFSFVYSVHFQLVSEDGPPIGMLAMLLHLFLQYLTIYSFCFYLSSCDFLFFRLLLFSFVLLVWFHSSHPTWSPPLFGLFLPLGRPFCFVLFLFFLVLFLASFGCFDFKWRKWEKVRRPKSCVWWFPFSSVARCPWRCPWRCLSVLDNHTPPLYSPNWRVVST